MAAIIEELYRRDFYAWTRDQAQQLRELKDTRPNLPLDLEHLAEEIESLGLTDLRRVRSHVRRIIEHLLKLEHSPSADPRRKWQGSILESRIAVADILTRALHNDLVAEFTSLYRPARKSAALRLLEHDEAEAAADLPSECPYTVEQVLEEDWYPANRHGIIDRE